MFFTSQWIVFCKKKYLAKLIYESTMSMNIGTIKISSNLTLGQNEKQQKTNLLAHKRKTFCQKNRLRYL